MIQKRKKNKNFNKLISIKIFRIETFAYYRSFDIYLKSPEFTKNLTSFAQLTCIFIICSNNKKYDPHNNSDFTDTDLFKFNEDFFENLDKTDIINLSILPNLLVKNILQIISLLRKSYPDIFVDQMSSTRTILYFSIIYSSEIDMIQNPHLRSELLEIILALLIVDKEEKKNNGKSKKINKF